MLIQYLGSWNSLCMYARKSIWEKGRSANRLDISSAETMYKARSSLSIAKYTQSTSIA